MKFLISMMVCVAAWIVTSPAADRAYSNPVIPGDFPDPSVIRVGADYWATATTSEWAPLFPILHSTDLVNWKLITSVFQQRPDWAVGNFWAPEISSWRGRYFVYYVGRKAAGPLSIAVASSERPEGPYRDHGPMIGQDAGSIDPVPVTDENGVRYLIWKEDGNSRKKPTPLWAQALSEDGTKLIGPMTELFHNDSVWEGNVVEGPFVVRRNGWFYLFYSGNACCGRGCHYGLGVARSKKLLGPWEKNPANPILADNQDWRCPGHGSLVSDSGGQQYLLYHAYDAKDFTYVGRQALLDQVNWNELDWPVINEGRGPSTKVWPAALKAKERSGRGFADKFDAPVLRPEWQWPQNMHPNSELRNGRLWLSSLSPKPEDVLAAILAILTTQGDYVAITEIPRASLSPGVMAGLSAFGDRENALGIYLEDEKLTLWKRQRNRHEILSTMVAPAGKILSLRVTAHSGHRFVFSASGDGKRWQSAGTAIDLEGDYLPPWDRGIRIALTSNAPEGRAAAFESFQMRVAGRND
jgi:xylan 1,4-beta-xylosidase